MESRCLILDVMLPGFDGFDICHRLRAETATAKMPIMMLSSKQQRATRMPHQRLGPTLSCPNRG